MKKVYLAITVTLLAVVFTTVLYSQLRDNRLATIEGVHKFISSEESVGFAIYRPDYSQYTVNTSEEFLSILQIESWKKETGRWSIDMVIWDEVIIISYIDGGRTYIENGKAVTYWEYAVPVVGKRYTIYTIPIEVQQELIEYVLENYA